MAKMKSRDLVKCWRKVELVANDSAVGIGLDTALSCQMVV